ncbi:MAG: CpaF family protein [Actinomycetota bacterium]
MNLGRRLATHERRVAARGTGRSGVLRPNRDPRAELRDELRDSYSRDLGRRISDADNASLRDVVAGELERMISARSHLLNEPERRELALSVIDDVLGYGPIQPMLNDPDVSEIMVNGTDYIYVERKGILETTNRRFDDDEQLKSIIVRIAASVGRRIDDASPMVDARLHDGSRVNAVIPPLAVDGPVLTIRKFAADTLTADDLVAYGSLTDEAVQLLRASVEGRLNIVVSGGTGSGKTTFLNMLSGFIPESDRIVTIEDAVELQLRQHHVIRLECRTANVEGRGAIGTRELVRNSLRMRPDRIIVGECRGPEAIDMLQAMSTGHDGSLGTLHANSPADALTRLETMVLMAGLDLPIGVVREQMASALDLIVQLDRLRTGARVVTSICEVKEFDDDTIVLNPLFVRRFHGDHEGVDDTSTLEPTGADPGFAAKLARHGVLLPTEGSVSPPIERGIRRHDPPLPPLDPRPFPSVKAPPPTHRSHSPDTVTGDQAQPDDAAGPHDDPAQPDDAAGTGPRRDRAPTPVGSGMLAGVVGPGGGPPPA